MTGTTDRSVIDVVDPASGEPVGRAERRAALDAGLPIRTVHLFLFTDDGRLMLQVLGRERDRHVAEPAAARRLGDDGALVADDRVVEARLERVRPDRPEHPAGDEDDVDPGRAGGGDRAPRALVQEAVLGDERAVEVARERVDRAGEVRRESQLPLVRNVTRASTWALESDAKLGMTFGG